MLRELKVGDTPRFLVLLKNNFPEEEALMGTRPEGVTRIVRRVFRWDTRFFLGLLRLLGRSFFRFYVIEADHQVVATTFLSFSEKSGYVSMVVVDPARRRQGLARRLLEQARVATVRRGAGTSPWMSWRRTRPPAPSTNRSDTGPCGRRRSSSTGPPVRSLRIRPRRPGSARSGGRTHGRWSSWPVR